MLNNIYKRRFFRNTLVVNIVYLGITILGNLGLLRIFYSFKILENKKKDLDNLNTSPLNVL